MRTEQYWLGPGNLSGKTPDKPIRPDTRIPDDILENMSEARFKHFKKNGYIGDAPRAAAIAKAANNAQERIKILEAENAELRKELDGGVSSSELKKIKKAGEAAAKERDKLFDMLKKADSENNESQKQIQTLTAKLKELKKDFENGQKEMLEAGKLYGEIVIKLKNSLEQLRLAVKDRDKFKKDSEAMTEIYNKLKAEHDKLKKAQNG